MSTLLPLPRITLENFGPFREATVEIRPLTVFIGRNSVGESFLLCVIWLLESAYPDLSTLTQEAEKRGATELVSKIVHELREWKIPSTEFRQLVKIFTEVLPQAIATTLKNLLEKTFGIELSKIIYRNAEKASMTIGGRINTIKFDIYRDGKISAMYVKYDLDLISHYDITILPSGEIKIVYKGEELRELYLVPTPYVNTVNEQDVLRIIVNSILPNYVANAFGFVFATGIPCALLVDSRAGIARTLLRPYAEPFIMRELSYPDEYYIQLHRYLVTAFKRS